MQCDLSIVKVVQQGHVRLLHLSPGEIEHVIAQCVFPKVLEIALPACVRERVSACRRNT